MHLPEPIYMVEIFILGLLFQIYYNHHLTHQLQVALMGIMNLEIIMEWGRIDLILLTMTGNLNPHF